MEFCNPSVPQKVAMQSAVPVVATVNGGYCYVHDKAIGSCCLIELHCVVVAK